MKKTILLLLIAFPACTSTGALDPNAPARILSDLACLSALAGAYLDVGGAMPESPTAGDVVAMVAGASGSSTAAATLNACAQMLANAGQDVAGLQTVVRAKAAREGVPTPRLAPPPLSTEQMQ